MDEIRSAVDAGDTVHWQSEAYRVVRDSLGRYLITCQLANGSCIALTWADNKTLNGKEEEFYMAP